jgi:hypothetical protein
MTASRPSSARRGTIISFNHVREGGGAIFFVSNDRTGTLLIKQSKLHTTPATGSTPPGTQASSSSATVSRS